MSEVRENVREVLKQNGIKHKWLHEQLGISKSHFSHWLRGERDLKQDHINKIKEVLKIN
ncbi:hypothetical protein Amet_2851 [Alkaliphilus metalliredigens QYMF]|uniref:HTH cro/C1-type domain-containing protein n=1 Tax=Alkaliphilus metalliredigens (strain QYMF) TaxID=293826 RepID=A6TS33_ALKMQ|nr:hypothetical protein Amet_2851 [Alkaliphilus metalliredigens QYMF]